MYVERVWFYLGICCYVCNRDKVCLWACLLFLGGIFFVLCLQWEEGVSVGVLGVFVGGLLRLQQGRGVLGVLECSLVYCVYNRDRVFVSVFCVCFLFCFRGVVLIIRRHYFVRGQRGHKTGSLTF